DSKLGLGAGDEDPFKPGMGAGDEDPFKPGMGAGDEDPFKPGMGAGDEDPFKPGMGVSTNPMSTVAGLYGQVAQALRLSEESVAKIEGVVRSLLTNGAMPQDDDYNRRGIEQVRRSFRELKEVLAQAKRTTGWVVAHPAYGLGPSLQTTQGPVPREQFAMVGGL